MNKTTFGIVFGFLISSLFVILTIPFVEAIIVPEDRLTLCREGQTLVFVPHRNDYICTSKYAANQWIDLGIANPVFEEDEEPVETQKDVTPIDDSILAFVEFPPQIDPEKGYFVIEVKDGLYWVIDEVYQAMFLTTGQGVIVVDAPKDMGAKLLDAISEVTDEPITHLIYSHIHQDHIGAAHIFPDDVTIIAHEDTAQHLAMKNDPNRPVPTETFSDEYELSVGNQVLELSYIGAFHSKGDIVIYAPEQKVLMVVDLLHPRGAPFKAFAVTTDLNAYIDVHDKILEYDFELLISGHEQIFGIPDDVSLNKEYVMSVKENAMQALQTVDFMEFANQYGSDGFYAIFENYLDSLKQSCADTTISQWQDRLHSVGYFTKDDCQKMLFHLMID